VIASTGVGSHHRSPGNPVGALTVPIIIPPARHRWWWVVIAGAISWWADRAVRHSVRRTVTSSNGRL
jgi:hypothetical protein